MSLILQAQIFGGTNNNNKVAINGKSFEDIQLYTDTGMDSIPGAFPGLYSSSRAHSASSNRAAPLRPSQTVPSEAITIKKSFNTRRKLFKENLLHLLDILTYFYIMIEYLYDCSFVLLVVRSFVQTLVVMLRTTPALQLVLEPNYGKKPSFLVLVISNALCVLIHITRDLPIPEDDGYLYGHHTLQVIGQHPIPNKFWLVLMDVIIFYVQLSIYVIQFSPKKQDNTIRSALLDQDYDGFQGETLAAKIPLISALKLPLPAIQEFVQEEDAETQRRSQNSNTDQQRND